MFSIKFQLNSWTVHALVNLDDSEKFISILADSSPIEDQKSSLPTSVFRPCDLSLWSYNVIL